MDDLDLVEIECKSCGAENLVYTEDLGTLSNCRDCGFEIPTKGINMDDLEKDIFCPECDSENYTFEVNPEGIGSGLVEQYHCNECDCYFPLPDSFYT